VLKVTKLTKIALKPCRKKIAAAAAAEAAANYKGHRRYPLLLGVGRLAAATVGLYYMYVIMGLRSWSFALQSC